MTERFPMEFELAVLSQSANDILRVFSPRAHCLLKAVSVNALDILVA